MTQRRHFHTDAGPVCLRLSEDGESILLDTPTQTIDLTDGGGGGGSSYSVSAFQREHNAATAIGTALATLEWDTAKYEDAGFSYAAGVLTIGPELAGRRASFCVAVNVDTNSNNRAELVVELQKDTGGGFQRVQGAGCYATRNNNQDKGGAVIAGWLDTLAAGVSYRVQVVRQGVAISTEPAGCFWSVVTK